MSIRLPVPCLAAFLTVTGAAGPPRAIHRHRHERRQHRPPAAHTVVHRPPRRTIVSERAGVSSEAVRLQAAREDDSPADRLLRCRQRVGRSGAARLRHATHRANELRLRDVHGKRAHVVPDESRAGARHDERSSRAARPLLPRVVSRQGRPGRRASRVGPISLSDRAAARGAALVHGRHRGVPRHLDGRRSGPCTRAVRRDGVPLDGDRRQPLRRPARAGCRN